MLGSTGNSSMSDSSSAATGHEALPAQDMSHAMASPAHSQHTAFGQSLPFLVALGEEILLLQQQQQQDGSNSSSNSSSLIGSGFAGSNSSSSSSMSLPSSAMPATTGPAGPCCQHGAGRGREPGFFFPV
jgi:hypothetical protein